MRFDPDDPRLTAYVLGELDEDEQAEVEALLRKSPEARKALGEIRSTVQTLTAELKNESTPQLTPQQRQRVTVRAAKRTRPSGRLFSSRYFPLAASIFLIIGVGLAVGIPNFMMKSQDRSQLSETFVAGRASVRNLGTHLETSYVDHNTYASHQVVAFAQNLQPYDSSNGTTSVGDVVRVGEGTVPSAVVEHREQLRALGYLEGPVRSAVSKYSTFQIRTPSLDIRAGNNVNIYGTTGQGWMTATVTIEGQEYSCELQETDPTAPIPYTSNIPTDPFRSLDNDGDGRIDEIIDANGNTFTVQPVPKPEHLGGTEAYDRIYENPFVRVMDNPLSTFSIDVDTASYANVRRFLNEGRLPPPDAVRIEEFINYFTYDYEPPFGPEPFSTHVEVAGCPWNLDHRLLRIGLKGKEVPQDIRPPSNLVFLLDVSGSMDQPNKLPLVISSMKKLVEHLTAIDRVAIVVYAGASGLVLPSTSCDDQQTILDALERLKAGGSTHGSAGIQLAYEVATDNFIKDGVNRVILCTDGDFNVGVTDRGQLIRLIEEKAKSGVFLSVLGFGSGNLKDSTMEQLADKGNGNYAYIDTLREGEKVLVEQMEGTLVTIAKDVKIQIEFNPAQILAYRLIGYENRMLKKEDFNDDTKDAGEIGAGHTVTALYELITSDRPMDEKVPDVDPLKYQKRGGLTSAAGTLEILTLKLRYKEPDGDTSKLIEQPVTDSFAEYSQASDDFKFAASVAAFGMILRDSEHKGNATLEMVAELGHEGMGADPKGYRAEFLELVKKADELSQSR